MKVLHIYCIFFLMVTSPFGLYAKDEVDLSDLTCDVPACSKLAKQVAYEPESLTNAITLKTELFAVLIPDDSISKIISSERDTIIYYKNGAQLLVSEDSGPDVGDLQEMKVNQFPEVVFLKTAADPEPKRHQDRFFWRVALYQKAGVFDSATTVTFSEADGLSYFVTDSTALGFSGGAMVSAVEIEDVFLTLKAVDMNFDKFSKIVSSVNTRK